MGTEPKADGKEPLEPLTAREIAVAKGEDPDAVVSDADLVAPAAEEAETVTDDGGKEAEGQDAPLETTQPPTGGAGAGEPSGQGSEPSGGGRDAADDSWVNDDVLALASSYGMDKAEVEAFNDPDSFLQATRLLDKNLLAAGQQPGTTTPPATEQASAAPAPPQVAPNVPSPADIDVQSYIDAGYDENTIKLVKAYKAQADRLAQVEQAITLQAQQQQAAMARQQMGYYHDAVDQLDEARFGRSVDQYGNLRALPQAADANRKKLYETATLLRDGMVAQAQRAGKSAVIPPLPVLLKRAEQLAFAEDLRKADREKFQQKVVEQSKRRRPAAAHSRSATTRPAAAEESPNDEVSRIANDPGLVKAWQKFNEESGSA